MFDRIAARRFIGFTVGVRQALDANVRLGIALSFIGIFAVGAIAALDARFRIGVANGARCVGAIRILQATDAFVDGFIANRRCSAALAVTRGTTDGAADCRTRVGRAATVGAATPRATSALGCGGVASGSGSCVA
jgi:hypothetical protein